MSANKAANDTTLQFARNVVATLTTNKNVCFCSLPNEKGWHLDDEVITTYRSLRLAEEKNFIDSLGYFLNVYWKKGDDGIAALQKHFDAVSNREIEVFCEWER